METVDLRRVEPVGRRREAAELSDPVERLELPQVHENRNPRETYLLDIGILELDR